MLLACTRWSCMLVKSTYVAVHLELFVALSVQRAPLVALITLGPVQSIDVRVVISWLMILFNSTACRYHIVSLFCG